jgi:excisionase family DNA binding protein
MTWLNVPEAADLLGVSPRWIRRRIAEKRLPFAYYKTGKHLRFCSDDIDAYLMSVVVRPTSADSA